MAWIESHQSLQKHRKTLAAAEMLHADRHKLLGHLHCLWWWALDNVGPDGSLDGISDRQLASGAEWKGEASRFVDALSEVRFIDVDADGRRWLHDWYNYAGKLLDRREANAERMRKARGSNGVQRTCNARADPRCNARAPATVPNRTQPYPTVPDNEDHAAVAVAQPEKKSAGKPLLKSLLVPPELQEFHRILRESAADGYKPTSDFLQKVLDKYGGLDLDEEAIKMGGWIASRRGRKLSTAFVLGWLRRAATGDGAATAAQRNGPIGGPGPPATAWREQVSPGLAARMREVR